MSKKFSQEEFQEFVIEQFGRLTADVADARLEAQTGFRELRVQLEEVKETLSPMVTAFDADAEKVVEHDRRIGRLEEHVGMPKHA